MRLPLLAALFIVLAGCLGPGDDAGSRLPVGGSPEVREFDLYVFPMWHSPYPGVQMLIWGFTLSDDPATAQVPGPEIRVRDGDRVVVHFHNTMAEFNHTVHWDGLHVPWDMDGAPYMGQVPVQPGETFDYEFVAGPPGTHWYHCHVDSQHHIDMGMYGPFIVEPRDGSAEAPVAREYT
ncbi:MAG: multicopper oxidase domain-containing protein [Methanobacteriota archaeon]